MKTFPSRPIAGGTNNGTRQHRYHYWRAGYAANAPPGADFWVVECGEFHAKPNYVSAYPEHAEHTQAFYHLAGKGYFEYDGRAAAVTPGDVMVIPPGFRFAYGGRGVIKHHWWAMDGVWPGVFGERRVQVWSLPYNAEVEAGLVELREILILRQPGHSLRALGAFYNLMARLAEISGAAPSPESEYPEGVRNAMVFLRENYARPFSAAQTAAAVGLSEPHLRALFRQWVGESPRRYHTRCRIEQAKRLLSEQRLPVSEVALHVGVADASHFSHLFKDITGVAPSQFARARR
ncbi:MAG: helix-turn-helix domain-containing protein [Anaerolineae bacterium]